MSRSGKGQSLLWEQNWAAQRLHAPIVCWFSNDMRKRTAHLQRKELNPEIRYLPAQHKSVTVF